MRLSDENGKLNDYDLEEFLNVLGHTSSFYGELILSNQNLTNESVIRISRLLRENKVNLTSLDLSGNTKISYIGGQNLGDALKNNITLRKVNLQGLELKTKGNSRIIESIVANHYIREFNFGKLGEACLKNLVSHLRESHHIKNLTFAEDLSAPWTEETKTEFLYCMRDCLFNKQILSVNIECESDDQLLRHKQFICELAISCKNNRAHYILMKNNDYKSKELNTKHPEYFDSDNHAENAFKFSVKTYIQNVIETLLDEGLYYLERERQNMLRDEKIFQITQKPINKTILEDLLTADGSILVLCKYMIRKIKEKPELSGQF